jgi:hypothetical protein
VKDVFFKKGGEPDGSSPFFLKSLSSEDMRLSNELLPANVPVYTAVMKTEI